MFLYLFHSGLILGENEVNKSFHTKFFCLFSFMVKIHVVFTSPFHVQKNFKKGGKVNSFQYSPLILHLKLYIFFLYFFFKGELFQVFSIDSCLVSIFIFLRIPESYACLRETSHPRHEQIIISWNKCATQCTILCVQICMKCKLFHLYTYYAVVYTLCS